MLHLGQKGRTKEENLRFFVPKASNFQSAAELLGFSLCRENGNGDDDGDEIEDKNNSMTMMKTKMKLKLIKNNVKDESEN